MAKRVIEVDALARAVRANERSASRGRSPLVESTRSDHRELAQRLLLELTRRPIP